jgi:hypothetical protein
MDNLQKQLIDMLTKLGLEHVPYPERDDGFCALRYNSTELAHFHNFNELDLRLSKAVIRAEGLSRPADSQIHPNRSASSPWIELRFRRVSDLEAIVRLVQLAMDQAI